MTCVKSEQESGLIRGVTTEEPALQQRRNYVTFKRCWVCVKLGFRAAWN